MRVGFVDFAAVRARHYLVHPHGVELGTFFEAIAHALFILVVEGRLQLDPDLLFLFQLVVPFVCFQEHRVNLGGRKNITALTTFMSIHVQNVCVQSLFSGIIRRRWGINNRICPGGAANNAA